MACDFLAEELRRADYDRYLLTFFAPDRARPALRGLFLLAHEIARTRSIVTDTNLGLIRLQWWREEIGKIFGGGGGGQIPVLSTLAPYIHQQILPQDLFDSLIYAHEFDLEDVPPSSWDGLCHYADFTTTPLNTLALKIIGEAADSAEIRQISTNFGLFRIIRGVPFRLAERRCLVPQDWLDEKDISVQKLIDFNHKQDIVHLCARGASLIETDFPAQSRFLDIQQRMTRICLKKLKKHGFDIFDGRVQAPPPFLALRLALNIR